MANQMKKYLFIFLFIFMNCNSENDYYFGRVLDENNNPVENAIVIEDNFEGKTKTNNKGYFKLKRNSGWLGNLIFYKEGFKTDTIPSVRSQHGETLNYNFIEKDTTIVKLQRSN